MSPPTVAEQQLEELTRIGTAAGLDHIGVAPAAVMERARRVLYQRRAEGLSDSMQFTYRNPVRSTDPDAAVRGARSMIVAARSYVLDEPPKPEGPVATVARYAWIDHYAPLRAGLQAIVQHLRAAGHKAVAYADDNSVVDREAAWLGGLGWFGKNANLLVPGAGSFFVLGAVVTTAELPVANAPVADGCGACHRCIEGCPTGAIVAAGTIDARRCLAWLLQRPGVFPREHRIALGARIYGCDECQVVCPPTVRGERRVASATSAPSPAPDVQAWVPLLDLLRASDEQLLARYGRWYLADRNPMWMRRNALVVLANVADPHDAEVVATLTRHIDHSEPILRAHAVWAAARLGLLGLLPGTDADPDVRAELAHLPDVRADLAAVTAPALSVRR